ncbi:MAG: DUF2203 family protein [Candidatus Omnitrophica bacterium]|jgi:hypothetical protein|nr:DUF2203 family protein [Candidatus Omnitrophota bacterium]
MRKPERFYTLEEATALIPLLDSRMRHLIAKKEVYDRRHDQAFLHELISEAERSALQKPEAPEELERDYLSLEEDLMDLQREASKITQLGCVIQGIETGWIDLPGIRNGEFVFFCWKSGDAAIRYYRPYQSEAGERRPID